MAKGNGMLSEELLKLLNYRINQEELSARLYEAMSSWLDARGYFGASKMLSEWGREEMDHAQWTKDFMESHDYMPETGALAEVPNEYESLKDVMMKAYDHEIEITEQCNDLTKKVVDTSCYSALPLALKYMKEQNEELKKSADWLNRINLVGDDPRELMLIDREMGRPYGLMDSVEEKSY